MKNIKFGVFSLGLLVAVVTAVSGLGAQTRVPFDVAQAQAAPGYEPSARTSWCSTGAAPSSA